MDSTLERSLPYTKESLTSTQTTPRQRKIALIASISVILALFGILPFASQPLIAIPTFVAITSAPTMTAFLITAYLLLSQFLVIRTPSIAALGAVYLYACAMLLPYMLTFPGIFSASGLLGATPQTAAWIWIFWHLGFPFGIFIYVVAERTWHTTHLSHAHACLIVLFLVPLTLLITTCISALLLLLPSLLPPIIHSNQTNNNLFVSTMQLLVWSANLLAFISILLFTRKGTLIQLWLRVVALLALLDVTLSVLSVNRYSLGWYTSRISGLIESIVLLWTLLYEVNHLYSQIASQNDELFKQNEIQNNFVSVVSHEFRTALTSIQGFSEIMLTEDFTHEEAKEFASDMNSDAYRLSRLINDMLDLDRMRSGAMKVVSEQISLNMLIEQITTRLRSTTLQHLLRTELDPTIPMTWGDHDKIIQLLTNLLSNAIKYSPQGGEIQVKSWREQDMVHITIHDQGIGIPPEQLELIFERYTRVETTNNHYINGTGLGLPIVRQIVQMHGGRVWAESTLGQGSTFHVTLPLVRAPALMRI